MLVPPFTSLGATVNSDDNIYLKRFGRIKCNHLDKVPGPRHYSINASFVSSFSTGPHAVEAGPLYHSAPTFRLSLVGRMAAPQLEPGDSDPSASARSRGGALGRSSALYGSSFAPEAVLRQGLERSGHGGAEVGKMAWRGWVHRGWGCGQAWAPPVGSRGCEELPAVLSPPRLLGRR